MRLSTRSRYALVAIADVALHGSRGPVALSTIGERHGISLSYLEMLFSALRRAGLVVSIRGPGGGYLLARSACDITVADIAIASEQGKNGQIATDHDTMTAHHGAMTHTPRPPCLRLQNKTGAVKSCWVHVALGPFVACCSALFLGVSFETQQSPSRLSKKIPHSDVAVRN